MVVPAGLGDAMAAPVGSAPPFDLTVYTDPSRQTSSSTVQQVVAQVVGGINQQLSGRPPALAVSTQTLQTESLTNAAYFVPSILGMALMQLGVFAAIPLTAQREKLILKRLGATPLSRGTLVASNVLTRLLLALVQTLIIVGIGSVAFGVTIVGSVLVVAGLVVLGAMTFLSIGYLIASYARTEDIGQHAGQRRPVPAHVPVGHLLPDRLHARVAAPGRRLPAADLPGRRLAPDDGWRGRLRLTQRRCARARSAGCVVSFLISARFFRWQ